MRALNELVIRGPGPEVAAYLQRLDTSLTGGWRRDRELEARLHGGRGGGDGVFCFRCTEAPRRPAAVIWVKARRPDEWHVFNIVPLGQNTLSDEEYNHVLDEFADRLREAVSYGSPVRVEILPPEIRLEDYLSPEAARRLRAFSAAADRTALTPLDRERWQQFLFRAHRDETIMEGAFLEEWLASEGWAEAGRAELAREYESTRMLLARYDEEQRC